MKRQIVLCLAVQVGFAVCAGTFDGLLSSDEVVCPVQTHLLRNGWQFRRADESAMRSVTVPHDWAIEQGFRADQKDPHHGSLPYAGKGFYRRAFDGFMPAKDGRTYLTLDGVQCRSVVKLNGKAVGGRPFGYASETIDVTDSLLPAGNVLEVEAENVLGSSRWYPGSGIFRDVTVRVRPRDHVKPNTLFVRTLSATEKSAEMAVSFAWRGGVSNFTFTVAHPRLWSPESPALYELELFGETFRYGIRTAIFDPQKGFFLNGRHRQMRGVCLHHDLGPVGAAFDRDVARRQLALLKEMGCDAIRTSHNPPAAALLDLCDEMGVMVMDEAFDMWELSKGDYSNFWDKWHARDLAEFVRRDRSHPSVVMWSIGNELREFDDEDPARQIRIASELTGIVRENDPTRPVTFGSWKEAPMWNGCQNAVDAFGANYLPFKYAEFTRRNPKVGLVGTETCSTVSSRGEYFFPVVASPIRSDDDLKRRRDEGRGNMIRGAQMSGYDLWGPHVNDYPPDIEFEHQERNPQVYGEFVWTGFDYLGEPDPCANKGGRSSYFGIFDLAGFPKDRYWLYKSQWRPDVPTAHILPHWTWPGREGEITPVHVYTSGDEAELFVNGVSQGRKRRGKYEYRFRWDDVRYQPGELKVKTWRKGEPWAEDVVKTAGEPVRIERTERRFGRLTYVTLAIRDANGTLCPNADRAFVFETKTGTRLVALCNGDPSSYESFRGTSMRTFHGLLLAIVEGEAKGLTVRLVVHVDAERGDDAGDGSAAHPFRTPERARQAVRVLKAKEDFAGAEVALCGTFSYPTNTFELTAADSGTVAAPIVWRSGERAAVFDGAHVFAAAEFRPVTDEAVRARLRPDVCDKVRVLDLRARGIELPRPADKFLVWEACELYCGGRAGTLAREPNRGWYTITAEQEVDRGVQPADKSKGREFEWGIRGGTFAYGADFKKPESWPVADGVWLYGYFCMDWYSEAVRVGSVDTAKRHVTFAGVPFYGVGVPDEWKPHVPPRRYYAFNFLEAIDVPGEWYVDTAKGLLYLYPVDDGEVRLAVRREPVVRLNRTTDLVLQGIDVAHSAATNAVDLLDAKRVMVKGLDLSWTMVDGLRLRGGRDLTLVDSHLRQVGRNWTSIYGGDRPSLTRSGFRITGCEFDHCGRNTSIACGLSFDGVGVRVDHNRLHDTPYIALRYGGNEHLIDHNEIWCAMLEGGDGGAVYTGRDWGSQGNVVSNNYIHHLGASGAKWRQAHGLPVEYESDARPQGEPMTMGVYLDDCDSGDTIVGNVFEETGYGAFVGGGRHNLVRSNTMIRCKVACHLDTRGVDRARPGKNIPNDSWDLLAKVKRACGASEARWKERYPWLFTYMDDEPLLPLHTEFTDNTAIDCQRFFSLTGKGMPDFIRRLRVTGNRAFGMSAEACQHMNSAGNVLRPGF